MKKKICQMFFAPPSAISGGARSNQKQFPELDQLLKDIISPIVQSEFKSIVENNPDFKNGTNAWKSLKQIDNKLEKLEGIEEDVEEIKDTKIPDVVNTIQGAQEALTENQTAAAGELKDALTENQTAITGEIRETLTKSRTAITGEIKEALAESRTVIANQTETWICGILRDLWNAQKDLTESQTASINDNMARDRVYIKRLLRVCAFSCKKDINRLVNSFSTNRNDVTDDKTGGPFVNPVRDLRDDLFKQLSECVEDKLKSNQDEIQKHIDRLNRLILFLFILSGISVAGIAVLICLSFR